MRKVGVHVPPPARQLEQGAGKQKAPREHPVLLNALLGCPGKGACWKPVFHPGSGVLSTSWRNGGAGVVPGGGGAWGKRAGGALDGGADKKLFEVKRKDQMNALKNLIELNDINQQYKIIDIMLKGLFKVSHSAGCPRGSVCRGAGEGGWKRGGPGVVWSKRRAGWAGGLWGPKGGHRGASKQGGWGSTPGLQGRAGRTGR